MEDAKISIYTMKKIFVERTTSCGMLCRPFLFSLPHLDAEKYEAPCGLFCRESGSGYFNAAACTSGTCTDKHQQYQDCPRNFGRY